MDAPGVYRRTSRGRLQLGKPTPASPPPARVVEALQPVAAVEIVAD